MKLKSISAIVEAFDGAKVRYLVVGGFSVLEVAVPWIEISDGKR